MQTNDKPKKTKKPFLIFENIFYTRVNVSDKFWYPHTVPSNFYFLSSRVIQLTSYFMILLVLIFIVNRNFKLLNRHSILLLCALTILLSVFFLYYYCLRYCCYCYLLITIIVYSLIYLFIYWYLLHHLFVCFVVLTCIRHNLLSPLPT